MTDHLFVVDDTADTTMIRPARPGEAGTHRLVPIPDEDADFNEKATAAVELVRDHPGVEHIWLNAFRCVRPTDDFAAQVGREVITMVMAHRHPDVLKTRHIVLRVNAS